MNYNHDNGTIELTTEGSSIQTYLLSDKYPRLSIIVGRKNVWSKIWSWLVG